MTAQKPQQPQTQKDPIAERQARAWQALLEGTYQVLPRSFQVRNGNGKTYVVGLVPKPQCTCPDHQQRGIKCKHLWAVEALVRALWPDAIAATSEKTQEAPQARQTPKAQKPEEDPGARVLDFGKHAGKTLAQVWAEAPGYVRWMATSPYAPGKWAEVARDFLRRHHPEALQSRPSTQDRRNGGKKPLKIWWGKYKGKSLEEIAREDPDYIRWLAESYEPKDGYGQVIQRKARALHAKHNADINKAVFPNA